MTLGVESSALNQSVKNALADEKVVSLNVSPPLPRKDAPPSPKGKYLVGSELRTKVDSLDPQVYSGRREVESIVPKSNPPLSQKDVVERRSLSWKQWKRRRNKKGVLQPTDDFLSIPEKRSLGPKRARIRRGNLAERSPPRSRDNP